MNSPAAMPSEGLDDLYAVIFDLLRPSGSPRIPTALDYAYDAIWRQLIKRERQPGDRLADTELAAQLGISRTPVRQALHRLAQEELVRFDARRGFSVQVMTAEDVREIYDVRCALEALAVGQAAPNLSAGELDTLLHSIYEAREALSRARDQHAAVLHLQSDLRLHNALIHASRNGRLIRMLGALRSQQTLFQYWDSSYPDRNEAASREHEHVVRALMAGDAVAASRSMAEHILDARDRVLADLFQTPPPPRPEAESIVPDVSFAAETEVRVDQS